WACRVETSGTHATQGINMNADFTRPAAAQNDIWTCSADMSGASGGEAVEFRIAMRTAEGSMLSELVSDPIELTTTPTRYSFTATLTNASTGMTTCKISADEQVPIT